MNSQTLAKEIEALVEIADEIAPPTGVDPVDGRWLEAISAASSGALVGMIAQLDSGRGQTSRKRKAMREAAIAEAERRNSRAIIDTLHSLDTATTALNKRMFWLAVAGVLLATAQVIFALTQ